MAKYYIAAFAAVFLTAVAQLVLKKGAMTGLMKKGFIKSYFNFYSMLAHFIFFVVTVLKLFALKKSHAERNGSNSSPDLYYCTSNINDHF